MIPIEDLARAENTTAGMLRGLDVSPVAWGTLLAIAQRAMSAFQQSEVIANAPSLYNENNATSLIAVARMLEGVAEKGVQLEASSNYEEDEDDTDGTGTAYLAKRQRLLRLLASCAYAMMGNFPSAAAVQRKIRIEDIDSDCELVALAVCNPRQIGAVFNSPLIGLKVRDFLEVLNEFLIVGDDESRAALIPAFEAVMRTARTGSEVALVRCVRLAVAHLGHLAISQFRKDNGGKITSGFVDRLLEDHRYSFLPPQFTILSSGFLDSPENRLVTIPTSTGKTLLAEFAVIRSLEAGPGLSIFCVPYIALGNQVLDSLKRHVPKDIRVQGFFGGFRADSNLKPAIQREVVVATTERVDALLRSNNLYPWLRLVVFDEAHSIEGNVRGARMEALITRLRLLQRQKFKFQLLLLSAVLTEVEAIRNWLGVNTRHFQDSWRPTARRVAIWESSGRLTWMHGNDPLRPAEKTGVSDLGSAPLPWPAPLYAAEKYVQINQQLARVYGNIQYLARYLTDLVGGPILIVCGTKAATRGAARVLAASVPLVRIQHAEIDALLAVIARDAKHLTPLAEMLKHGVAYHNASVPPEIRRLIEEAVKAGAIKYVCATTTLAEGVDLPFRTTIVMDWLFGYKERQRPMSPLLFRNIAGRCGRAGSFTEGDTIIFDNMLGDLKYTQQLSRRDYQNTLFSDPPELQSAIANHELPKDDQSAINAALSSQLLAAIPENPSDQFVEKTFADQLYAAFNGRSPGKLLTAIREELLSTKEGEPFAVTASPMKLTPLGEAANRTGFSPNTCRRIVRFLETSEFSASWIPRFLVALGDCPEQSNPALRDIASGNTTRFYVKRDDIEILNIGWLSNAPLPELFANLPKAKNSKAQVHPDNWIQGKAESDAVAAQYDKFIEFMEQSFGGFVPWILRAGEQLSAIVSGDAKSWPWQSWIEAYETARTLDLAVAEGLDPSNGE